MKKNQTQIKKYAAVISIFLAAVIVGLFVFFFCIKRSVEQRSKNTMRNNVVRQSEHLRTILDIQYDYLNGLTEEIGKTDHLLAKKNMDLIKSITKHTDFGGTALIEPNGDAHYDKKTLLCIYANGGQWLDALLCITRTGSTTVI